MERWRTAAALVTGAVISLLAHGGCHSRSPRAAEAEAPKAGARVTEEAPPAEGAVPPALPLVAEPSSMTRCTGSFVVGSETVIAVDDDADARAIGARLAGWLAIPIERVHVVAAAGAPAAPGAIDLRLGPSGRGSGSLGSGRRDPSEAVPRDREEEAFVVDVSPSRAALRAAQPAGLFYAAETFAQLAGARPILGAPEVEVDARDLRRSVPCVKIEDRPRYRFRAMHLDVARHFFTREVVERYVDLLSFYRFNVFHWHLTDDQGFRLPVRSHPELTAIGGTRIEADGSTHAGSYSASDVSHVVAFAKERFVTVVPEIEMPGHARAILAAHPELSCTGKRAAVPSRWGIFEDVLCAGNDATFSLLEDVVTATTELFPSHLVHVGGDEVPKTRWNACRKCRAKMAATKVDAEGLQGAFMKRVGTILAAHGRRMEAWDEALEGGLSPDGVVVAWQDEERGWKAARAGHDVVMAPHRSVYFNFWQSKVRGGPGHEGYVPWEGVIAFEPGEKRSGTGTGTGTGTWREEGERVIGGEGALWTEFVKSQGEIERLVLPRMAALGDALWGGRGRVETFVGRFGAARGMLDAGGVRYFVEGPEGLRARKVFVGNARVEMRTPKIHPDGVVRFTVDGSEPVATSTAFEKAFEVEHATTVRARLFLPGGRTSDVVQGRFEPMTPLSAKAVRVGQIGVQYTYYEGTVERLADIPRMRAVKRGEMAELGFDDRFRSDSFAVVYEGVVRAPADGVYRFVARADDGVRVDVDGARVLEDDGAHAARDADGEIALATGTHEVRVTYFQGKGGKTLSLQWEGPSTTVAPCPLARRAGEEAK